LCVSAHFIYPLNDVVNVPIMKKKMLKRMSGFFLM
jgi:hypothetical protein